MSVHKSAQSNKADTNDIDDWEKEFDDKMGNYTDGLPEMHIKGAKPVTEGFWLRSGMDGELDEQAVKDFIRQKIAQETNKARIDELERMHEKSFHWGNLKSKSYKGAIAGFIDDYYERIQALTADKEQNNG